MRVVRETAQDARLPSALGKERTAQERGVTGPASGVEDREQGTVTQIREGPYRPRRRGGCWSLAGGPAGCPWRPPGLLTDRRGGCPVQTGPRTPGGSCSGQWQGPGAPGGPQLKTKGEEKEARAEQDHEGPQGRGGFSTAADGWAGARRRARPTTGSKPGRGRSSPRPVPTKAHSLKRLGFNSQNSLVMMSQDDQKKRQVNSKDSKKIINTLRVLPI